jgi:hypothetical protein
MNWVLIRCSQRIIHDDSEIDLEQIIKYAYFVRHVYSKKFLKVDIAFAI